MPYLHIEDFRGGVDRRRRRYAGRAGSLWDLANCHITRGREIERRKKFVEEYTLPAGTFGFAGARGSLYVFGSAADPGVPSGVTYVRLQDPDGTKTMSRLLDWDVFGGKIYAVAEYSDGTVHHFYDGALVAHWNDGRVRAAMTNTDGIAAHLNGLLQADTTVSSSVAGSVITLVGPSDGSAVTVAAETSNVEGGTDDQTAVVAQTVAPVPQVDEVLASSSFTIASGVVHTQPTFTLTVTSAAGGDKLNSLRVDGTDILGAAVNMTGGDDDTSASDIADQVNAYIQSPNFTAVAVANVVTLTGALLDPAVYNGNAITMNTATGGGTSFVLSETEISGGVSCAIASLTVGGIEQMNNTVYWSTDNADLAADIKTSCDALSATPDYDISVSGSTVTITAKAGTGDAVNGYDVALGLAGASNFTIVGPSALAGGVSAVSGIAQQNTVTIGGTFDEGDRFTVTVDGTNYGAKFKPILVGRLARAFKGKMYSAAETTGYYSGVDDATVWNSDNVDAPGAGFTDFANQGGGASDITAISQFQGNLAMFTADSIFIQFVAADDTLNTLLSTVNNTGTTAAKSVLQLGNYDTFYLSSYGVRSLRSRAGTDTAFADDVGLAIDDLLSSDFASLSDSDIAAAQAVIEPKDGRYWLAVGQRIYVFSYFPGAEISAWSWYDLTDDVGGSIDGFVIDGSVLYARSGDSIYAYGGIAGTTYPSAGEITATVGFPFLTASSDGTFKKWTGIDVGCTNIWSLKIYTNPNDDENALVQNLDAGNAHGVTFGQRARYPLSTGSTHVAPVLECNQAGEAGLATVLLHFERQKAD